MKKILAISFLTMLPSMAFAQGPPFTGFFNGNQLYSWCVDTATAAEQTMCMMYIAGAIDGFAILDADPKTLSSVHVCLPHQVQIGQLKDLVVKYLKENPADRHGRASMRVMAAVLQTYPCK